MEPRPEGPVAKTVFLSKGVAVMDKDRISGAAQKAKGSIKDAAGKATGDRRLQAEGKADKVMGSMKDAMGKAKDAIRDADRRR
jgi:uncharacterized protein YjbJ (UPF0337 family)